MEKRLLESLQDGEQLLCFKQSRREPGVLTFPDTGTDAEGNEKKWDFDFQVEAVLRLYDEAGTLLQEQTFDDLYYGGNGGGRIP